jgi:hypothetical protein
VHDRLHLHRLDRQQRFALADDGPADAVTFTI